MLTGMAAPAEWNSLGGQWPHRQTSRFVRAGGLTWHVQIAGDQHDRTVLLVHGTGAATHSFRGMLPILARTMRVVAFDLPGHGFTTGASKTDLTLPGMASATRCLLDALAVSPQIAVGHSAGTAILLELALNHGLRSEHIVGFNSALEPIRGNALLSPFAKLLFANPLTSRLVSLNARFGAMADTLLKATGSRIDRVGRDCYLTLLRRSAHVNGALGMMANWDLSPLIANLPAIDAPVTLVAALDDPMVPAEVSRKAAARLADGHYVAVLAGGHIFHEQEPETASRLVLEAVQDTASSGSLS